MHVLLHINRDQMVFYDCYDRYTIATAPCHERDTSSNKKLVLIFYFNVLIWENRASCMLRDSLLAGNLFLRCFCIMTLNFNPIALCCLQCRIVENLYIAVWFCNIITMVFMLAVDSLLHYLFIYLNQLQQAFTWHTL